MKNLKSLGKVLNKKELSSINGGITACSAGACEHGICDSRGRCIIEFLPCDETNFDPICIAH